MSFSINIDLVIPNHTCQLAKLVSFSRFAWIPPECDFSAITGLIYSVGYDSRRFSLRFLWFLAWGKYYGINKSVSSAVLLILVEFEGFLRGFCAFFQLLLAN